AMGIGDLDDHAPLLGAVLHTVDLDGDQVVGGHVGRGAHAASPALPAPAPTMQRLCSMWYSNSWRKCLRKLCTGQAAASPKAHMVWPSIWPAALTNRSRSSGRPRPSSMRLMTRYIQPVPSRQGVHWPQD